MSRRGEINITRGPAPPPGSEEGGSPFRSGGVDRRCHQHPAGEILARSTREFLALPAEGEVGVRFDIVVASRGGGGGPTYASPRETQSGDGVAGGEVGGGGGGDPSGVAETAMQRDGSSSGSVETVPGGEGPEFFPRPQGFLELYKL